MSRNGSAFVLFLHGEVNVFVEAVLNQQQVLDPNLTQKYVSSKCKAVRLQTEEKNLMIKTTVESLSSKLL